MSPSPLTLPDQRDECHSTATTTHPLLFPSYDIFTSRTRSWQGRRHSLGTEGHAGIMSQQTRGAAESAWDAPCRHPFHPFPPQEPWGQRGHKQNDVCPAPLGRFSSSMGGF